MESVSRLVGLGYMIVRSPGCHLLTRLLSPDTHTPTMEGVRLSDLNTALHDTTKGLIHARWKKKTVAAKAIVSETRCQKLRDLGAD